MEVQEGQKSVTAFFEAKKNAGVKVETESDATPSDVRPESPCLMIGQSGISLRKTADHPTWRKEGDANGDANGAVNEDANSAVKGDANEVVNGDKNGVVLEADAGVIKVEADVQDVKVEVRKTTVGLSLFIA